MTKSIASLLAAATCAALSAAPAGAGAATLPELAAEVDADAAVYLAARPDALPGLFAWMRRLPQQGPGAPLRAWADGVAASSQQLVGFDATGSWDASGLDVTSPVVASIGGFDVAAVEGAFKARADKPGDAKALARAPRVFVRTRIVAVVVDEGKVKGVLARVAGQGGALALASAPPAQLGALFGGDARTGKLVAAHLKKVKAFAVWKKGEHVLFVRVGGGRLVVDGYWLFGESELAVKKDLPALAKLAVRKLGKTVAPVLTGPGTAGLADARVAFVVDPVRMVDLGRASGWAKTWEATRGMPDAAQQRSMIDTGAKEVEKCVPFRKLAEGGPLAGFVLTAKPAASGVGLEIAWPLRSAGALADVLATSDDGLVDLAAAKDAKLLALAPLVEVGRLAGLKKGTIYETAGALDEATMLCGYAAVATRLGVGWLHELGDFVSSNAQFGPLLADARNVALAVRRLEVRGGGTPELVALASNVGQPRHRELDARVKRSQKHAGKRRVDAWIDARDARGPWIVAAPGVDPKQTIYGVVWGGDATLGWWWGQPSPATTGGSTAFALLVRTELPWFLEIMDALMGGRAGLAAFGAGLGTLRALVALQPDHLKATITIEVK